MAKETLKKNESKNTELIQNIHYYLNEKGLLVFTELYLKQRGYCCKNGCKHCPYKF